MGSFVKKFLGPLLISLVLAEKNQQKSNAGFAPNVGLRERTLGFDGIDLDTSS
jgi:hypothetical protein